MTDPHVHFRDFDEKDKETILHGMRTGLEAGFNIFLDMPNTKPALTSRENVIRRLEEGKRAVEALTTEFGDVNLHYSLYLGLTADEEQIAQMTALCGELFPGVCGLKLFASQSTGNMGIVKKETQRRIYSLLSSLGYRGVLAVHSEKESLFQSGETLHSAHRPPKAEIESVSDQIENALSSGFKGNLHIAHISTKGALDLVREAKKDGMRITCGATPHHSLLTTRNEGIFTKMNPPLRDKKDRDAVLEALFDSTVDWAESDHAPHSLSDKIKGASGIPGFEGMLRLIRFLRREGMDEKRLNDLFSDNAVKVFSLPWKAERVPALISDEMIEKAGREYPYSAWSHPLS